MRLLEIADLFCGAGGSLTGAEEAAAILGYQPQSTAVNHWDKAVETLQANHPAARVLCTGVDNINPRDLFAENQLDVLLASPECTHFSTARGGRPVNEQSRATAMCVIRWAETMRPPVILIENVAEFRTWGPLIRKRVKPAFPSFLHWIDMNFGEDNKVPKDAEKRYSKEKAAHAKEAATLQWVPDPARKGELFRAWVVMLEATGYRVDHRLIRCADYGDPTTRQRLFVQCVRPPRKICWPEPTHAETPSGELFAGRKPWATARDSVIDWTLPGKSIYERKKALSPKTMRRIMIGLQKFGLKSFIVPQHNEQEPRSLERPAPTVTTTSRGVKLIEPFIIQTDQTGGNGHCVRKIDKPCATVVSKQNSALVEPFLVNMKGQSDGASINKPAPTVTAHAQHLNLAEPCLIKLRGTNNAADIDKPCPTVAAGGGHIALAEFLVQVNHGNGTEKNGNNRRVKSLDNPMPTVCGEQAEHALVEPFIIQVNHGKSADHARRARSLDEPLPTVAGNRGEHALIEPQLLPQHSGGALRPVSHPVPTVTTDGAIGLVEPYLVKFYGTADAASVDNPLDTVTSKGRFGLARPVIEVNGERYQLDIRFRMLQPHELAAAQGFKKGYEFKGNKTEIVKQIGNAVPRRTIRALILAAYGQQSNIGAYFDDKEVAA